MSRATRPPLTDGAIRNEFGSSVRLRELEQSAATLVPVKPLRRVEPVDIDGVSTRAGKPRLWLWYLIFAAPVTVLFFAFPAYHLVSWTSLGLSSVVATLVGVLRFRPRQRVAWYLLAGAEFCFIAGDTVYNLLVEIAHQDNPFPSIADVFYLLTYPLFAAGIFLLIRGRSSPRDRASLIDALIITTGLGLLSWVYLVVPNFQADGLNGVQRFISVAYPLGDVLVLAMLARLIADGGVRVRSMQLLVLGGAGLLVADVLYGLVQLNGVWQVGGPIDGGWVIFYVAWGCAALHPSMATVSEIPPRRAERMSRSRVAVLAVVSLIAPAVLVSEAVTGTEAPASTIGLFAAALFLLVIARLWGLLGVFRESVHRERALRSTSEALVAAQGLPDIYRVALDGVRALAGATPVTRAGIFLAGPDGIRQVAGSGEEQDPARLEELWQVAGSGGWLHGGGTHSVTPIRQDRGASGMLVVETAAPLTLEQHGALSTLAAQVALAVSSANLAEGLRRRRSEERFRGILQNSSDIIVIVDAHGVISYGTPSFGRNLDCSAEDLLGRELTDFLHRDDAAAATALLAGFATATTQTQAIADWRLRHRDGGAVAFEVLANNLLEDPRVGGIVLTMRDVSERRALEVQLKHQAFHDALTGLPNRALFQDRAAHALARTTRQESILAMVLLDLDDFKIVNDSRGHAAGDELLREVAARLQSALRKDATVSRFGGDEFAILIEDLTDSDQAERLAARALQPFATPFLVQGEELTVHASIGLVLAGQTPDSLDLSELMRCADLALYAAKERGKGQVVRYHDDLSTRMLDRITHRSDLQRALEGEELLLMYQPIVSIESGEIASCEALLRWQHPVRGLVDPMEFVPLAEESGLIVELGKWVLDQACGQVRSWAEKGRPGMSISVNVSARQLHEVGFVEDVRTALRHHELRPGQLVLELTESIFALDANATAEQLRSLRDIGVKIAMDDFGTGYSSLSYLQKLQLDILKIDKSFVDGLGKGDPHASALVNAIISLASSLQLQVVAEGVERPEQRDELWSMWCGLGQGYLYSRPIDADHLSALLSSSRQLGPVTAPGWRTAPTVRRATPREAIARTALDAEPGARSPANAAAHSRLQTSTI